MKGIGTIIVGLFSLLGLTADSQQPRDEVSLDVAISRVRYCVVDESSFFASIELHARYTNRQGQPIELLVQDTASATTQAAETRALLLAGRYEGVFGGDDFSAELSRRVTLQPGRSVDGKLTAFFLVVTSTDKSRESIGPGLHALRFLGELGVIASAPDSQLRNAGQSRLRVRSQTLMFRVPQNPQREDCGKSSNSGTRG